MKTWGFDYFVVTLLLFAAALYNSVRLGRRTGDWTVFDFVAWFALFAAVLFVAHLLESLRFWWLRRRNRGRSLLVVVLVVATVPLVAVAATPLPATVGVAHEGRVELSAVPHASGAWGTDYLTAAHGLRVGGNQITLDARQFETGRLVALCSGIVHGIDAMLLRVSAHRNRPVMVWGDAGDLKPGDELRVVPYDLPPITLRLVHHAFGQWAGRDTEEWPAEVNHALVAETQAPRAANGLSGYSGSPWMRNGRAYGLHKGSAKAKDDKIVALAEPVTRIKECFERTGYSP